MATRLVAASTACGASLQKRAAGVCRVDKADDGEHDDAGDDEFGRTKGFNNALLSVGQGTK